MTLEDKINDSDVHDSTSASTKCRRNAWRAPLDPRNLGELELQLHLRHCCRNLYPKWFVQACCGILEGADKEGLLGSSGKATFNNIENVRG